MYFAPTFKAPAKNLVFKRWDKLTENDTPAAVLWFAEPDVLSGLFTLSNFEEGGITNVTSPFASGCGSSIMWPLVEGLKPKNEQRSFLGMFDVSARPSVPENTLSFAMPIEKLLGIIEVMEESFLITPSWEKVMERFA